MRILWIAPLLLAANYLFMVARHEGAHALVAWASGASIVDVHLWPPVGGNLSWITTVSFEPRAGAVVKLEAALPHLISLAMLLLSLWWLTGQKRPRRLALQVELTGVAFPLLDLVTSTSTYWIGDNDFYYLFGPGRPGVRLLLSACVVGLSATAGWIAWTRRKEDRACRISSAHSTPSTAV
jgi:hypothetical protein